MQKRKAGAITPDAKKAKQVGGGTLSASLLKAASDNVAAQLKVGRPPRSTGV